MNKASTQKYSKPMRILHWITAIIIMTLLVVGTYMAGIHPDASDKYDLYPLHKAFGMIALLLVLVRLPVRFKSTLPTVLHGLKKWENNLSHLVHIGLYVAMLSMTLSGYFMNSTYLHVTGVDMFGLFTVPDITPKSEYWNGIFHEIHKFTAWAFAALLTLHLAGVAKHKFIDDKENDVLPRMM
jgi:cytochrome b561